MRCLAICAVITLAQANIDFHWVQPTCDPSRAGWTGCLRGQTCQLDGLCVSMQEHGDIEMRTKRRAVSIIKSAKARRDGRCGKQFSHATCDPRGLFGPCCSNQGYCGRSTSHCDVRSGCQSGCDSFKSLTQTSSSTEKSHKRAETATTIRNEEPVLNLPKSFGGPHLEDIVTEDGSCGAGFGGTVCGNWPRGACCSMYGYCGNSTAHCGAGCQSGPCAQTAVPVPNAVPAPKNANPGSFQVVADSGVPVMHAALLPNGRVAFLDKVENFTKLNVSTNRYAFSAEYDPVARTVQPLTLQTNPFCSGGAFLADGTLLSIGGNGPLTFLDPTVFDGFKGIRSLFRSSANTLYNGRSWVELDNLTTSRWYASAQTLGDGSIFVASGSLNGLDPTIAANNNPTYEVLAPDGSVPKQSRTEPLEILMRTQPYYMYPFIHLVRTGELFIFASKSSELWSPKTRTARIVYSDLPGDYRTYPNTGTSVMLPLSSANNWNPDILICGGGAYQDFQSPTDPSCGRLRPLADQPSWEMDAMPEGRGMVEGVLLPDGSVVFLNGANQGAQGFGLATKPTLEALLYVPTAPLGQRWSRLAASRIPRLYHSVALLLLDGTILVAGSNPVEQPVLIPSPANPFPTEFRIELYTPPYLSGDNAKNRPTNLILSDSILKVGNVAYNLSVNVSPKAKDLRVVLYHGGFVTHSLHMGQRMIYLDITGFQPGKAAQNVRFEMPPDNNVAPPGPYVVYVVVDGIPSVGRSVLVQ